MMCKRVRGPRTTTIVAVGLLMLPAGLGRAWGPTVLEMLSPDQRTEEGRKAIRSETTEQSIAALASITGFPSWQNPSLAPKACGIVVYSDLRVQQLVARAHSSTDARKEVVDQVASVIREYALTHDPATVGSGGKRWQTGYDFLLAVLCAVGVHEELPYVMKAFQLHQAEIGNPMGKHSPGQHTWVPSSVGHNRLFAMYFCVALMKYVTNPDLPEPARKILEDYAIGWETRPKWTFECGGYQLIVKEPDGPPCPIREAWGFTKAMENAGVWQPLPSHAEE